jgi:hypothetical protein
MADHPTFAGTLHGFFGPDSDTHWVTAFSIMVIMLGGYLVYSFDANKPTIAVTIPATVQNPAPSAPPLPVAKSEK